MSEKCCDCHGAAFGAEEAPRRSIVSQRRPGPPREVSWMSPSSGVSWSARPRLASPNRARSGAFCAALGGTLQPHGITSIT